jgi:signal transduction histidine kinase
VLRRISWLVRTSRISLGGIALPFSRSVTPGDNLDHARRFALQALAARGSLTRRDGELHAGDLCLRGNTGLVDEVERRTGYGCTLFDRNVRIATTAVAAGSAVRAIGTTANDDVTRQVFRLGSSFQGIAYTIGKDWVIAYDPLRDREGRIVGMLAVFRELLEFKHDLQRIQTESAVLRIAPDGTILDANLGATDHARSDRGNMLGSSLMRWLQLDWSRVAAEDTEFEATWVQPDGFSLVVHLQARWLGDSHLVVMRDFTAEARAREDLARANLALDQARRAAERANEGKSMFLANVSHELRTPLTAVLGYTQLLLEEAPEHAADLRRIESSGSFLLSLIDDLLDVTKARAGHLQVSMVSTDLGHLIMQLCEVGHELASTRGNRFTCEVGSLPNVDGDAKRIRQVLFNLLGNASKFTTGGQIDVTAQVTDDEVAVAVRDTGIGMDAEQLQELFVEFGQVHRTQRVELGGTGLGLALSQRLAEAMGGRLLVESVAGVGSIFTLCLRRSAP